MIVISTIEAGATATGLMTWMGYLMALVVAAGFSLGLRRLAAREGRHRVRRWVQAAHLAIWTGAAAIVIIAAASQGFTTTLVVLLLGLVALGVAGLGWWRSMLAGLVLFSEAEISPGDRIEVGRFRGEVLSMGIRSLRLRDSEGVIHDIPHSDLIEKPVSRFSEAGEITCRIDVEIDADGDPREVLETVRAVVGLAPLASPTRRPDAYLKVQPLPGKPMQISIRAYPASAQYSEEFRSDVLRRLATRFSPQPQ